jgi:hypothetical protein
MKAPGSFSPSPSGFVARGSWQQILTSDGFGLIPFFLRSWNELSERAVKFARRLAHVLVIAIGQMFAAGIIFEQRDFWKLGGFLICSLGFVTHLVFFALPSAGNANETRR